MNHQFKILMVLEEMAIEGRRYFSPGYLLKRVENINLAEMTAVLLSESFKDILITNYEVQCPDGDNDITVHSISDIPTDMQTCHQCGIDYYPDPKDIWITFNFTEEFKNEVKKKEVLKRIMQSNVQKTEKTLIMAQG